MANRLSLTVTIPCVPFLESPRLHCGDRGSEAGHLLNQSDSCSHKKSLVLRDRAVEVLRLEGVPSLVADDCGGAGSSLPGIQSTYATALGRPSGVPGAFVALKVPPLDLGKIKEIPGPEEDDP